MRRRHERNIRICGTGTAVPQAVLHSDELDLRLGLAAGSVYRRTGVLTRHCSVDETAAQLAVQACEAALREAGLRWDDIDCLVATSATMDQALPFNAALILAEAGARSNRIAAFDVGASCMSFLAGLDTLSYLVDAGRYRHVLLVSSDIATCSLDWSKPETAALFGDGAAAAVIRRSMEGETSQLLASRIETWAEGAEHCRIKAGGSRHHPRKTTESMQALSLFHMDGHRLFRLVARELPGFMGRLLDDAGLSLQDLELVVPHQASRLAIDHLVKRLHIDPERIVDILARYGNQVGASLPSALHHAIAGQRIERGQSMLLIGSGAGVTLGGIALVY